jgi:hypothetical protein
VVGPTAGADADSRDADADPLAGADADARAADADPLADADAVSHDADAESLADADADLDGVLRWSNAGYLVVHRNLLDAGQADAILALLDRHPSLVRDSVEADLVAYRVRR